MGDDVTVEITGAALSFLYYAASTSKTTKEGFIIGSVENRRTESITDDAIDNVKHETVVRVTGIYPCNKPLLSFYFGDGTLNPIALTEILPQGVVGWFFSRNIGELRPSARETFIHWQLCNQLSAKNRENFIFSLVKSSTASGSLVKEFETKFFHYNRKWSPLRGLILNQKSPNLEKTPYRNFPAIESHLLSFFTQQIMKMNVSDRSDHEVLKTIAKSGFEILDRSLENVSRLNKEIAKVEEEIREMELRQANLTNDSDQMDCSMENIPSSPSIGRPVRRTRNVVVGMFENPPTSPSRIAVGNANENPSGNLDERIRAESSSQEY